MNTNMMELNLNEMEMANGGYIVDRGFWRNYWVVLDWNGDIRANCFLKIDANRHAEEEGVRDQVISEAQYNEWLELKKQGKRPFYSSMRNTYTES